MMLCRRTAALGRKTREATLAAAYKFQRLFATGETKAALGGKLYCLHVRRGDAACQAQGGAGAAARQYSKAMLLAPERFEAYLKRGALLHGLGRHAEAILDLDRAEDILACAVDGNPENAVLAREYAVLLSRRGGARLARGEYGMAKEDFQRASYYCRLAMERCPEGEDGEYKKMAGELELALVGLGNAELGLGQYAAAKERFDEATLLPAAGRPASEALGAFWTEIKKRLGIAAFLEACEAAPAQIPLPA